MKMMTMGGAAIAAAMLMSAAPAAAQTRPAAAAKADPDAVCLIAITVTLAQFRGSPNAVSDEVKSTIKYFEGALHFYTGKLAAHYSAAQLGPVVKAGVAEFDALPTEEKPKRSADCTIAEGTVLKTIADALGG